MCHRYNLNGDAMPKPLTNMYRPAMSAYVPPDLAHRARTHASASRRSLSSVVAEALAAYFDRLDRSAELEQAARKLGV